MTTEKKSKLVFCLLAAVAGLIIVIVFILVGAWQVGSGKDKQLENLWAQSIEYNQSRVDAWNDYLELKDKYDFLLENELANYFEAYQRGVADAFSKIKVPDVIVKTVTENVTITNTEYVDRYVTRTEWRDFQSVQELAKWLENLSVLWISGQVVDCDDYSEYVWGMAYRDGYRLSEQLVWRGVLYGKYVGVFPDATGGHIDGLVNIGNRYYYFAANPCEYRIIYICDRD